MAEVAAKKQAEAALARDRKRGLHIVDLEQEGSSDEESGSRRPVGRHRPKPGPLHKKRQSTAAATHKSISQKESDDLMLNFAPMLQEYLSRT